MLVPLQVPLLYLPAEQLVEEHELQVLAAASTYLPSPHTFFGKYLVLLQDRGSNMAAREHALALNVHGKRMEWPIVQGALGGREAS